MQTPRRTTRIVEVMEEVHDEAQIGLADPEKTAWLLAEMSNVDVVISVVGTMLAKGSSDWAQRRLREAAADERRLIADGLLWDGDGDGAAA